MIALLLSCVERGPAKQAVRTHPSRDRVKETEPPRKSLAEFKVYPDYKDPHGHWTGLFGVSFSNLINSEVIDENKAPRDAMDYLDPAFKGKVILTYSHGDDAVLYQFWNPKQKYGWEYLEKLVATEPVSVRGTSMPYVAVRNGWYGASFTTSWSLVPFPNSSARFMLPEEDYFLTWFQTAAIPKKAKNKAAAKLYMSWICQKSFKASGCNGRCVWTLKRQVGTNPYIITTRRLRISIGSC